MIVPGTLPECNLTKRNERVEMADKLAAIGELKDENEKLKRKNDRLVRANKEWTNYGEECKKKNEENKKSIEELKTKNEELKTKNESNIWKLLSKQMEVVALQKSKDEIENQTIETAADEIEGLKKKYQDAINEIQTTSDDMEALAKTYENACNEIHKLASLVSMYGKNQDSSSIFQ